MIKSFTHKGLAELWAVDKTRGIDAQMHRRILLRLDRLDTIEALTETNVPGFNFHALNGFNPTRCSIHVNGPWFITFDDLRWALVDLADDRETVSQQYGDVTSNLDPQPSATSRLRALEFLRELQF